MTCVGNSLIQLVIPLTTISL
uniref:Uncharacterized protein n=1 Tax=Arundo donax TaxID=35708 RepID=A0A0A9AYV8_ARUDO